jgi:hypothetical protein
VPYRITWEAFGVHREYLGDVTIAERRASFDEICGDRRFDNVRYAVTDYLAVKSYEVTSDATAEIAALHVAPLVTNPTIVMAAVVDREDIIAAIEDFKRHGFTRAPYRLFRSMPEARTWVAAQVAEGCYGRFASPAKRPVS